MTSIQATAKAAKARPQSRAAAAKSSDLTEDMFTPTTRQQPAAAWVQKLMSLPVGSAEFEQEMASFMQLGKSETDDLLRASSRILDQATAGQSGTEAQMQVSDALAALRQQIDRIDPKHAYSKILGIFPTHNVRPQYVQDFRNAQGHIRTLAMDLYKGQDGLRKDNIVLEQQRQTVHDASQRLAGVTASAQATDEELGRQIQALSLTDPEKAEALQKQAAFYVRQKVQDLTTQGAVNAQAELVYGMIRSNNQELLKQVDRATQTTMAALQVGVTARVALQHQKAVMEKAQAMTDAAGDVVTRTAAEMKGETASLRGGSPVDPEALKTQLQAVYACLDDADEAKAASVAQMETALRTLQEAKA